MIRTRNGPRLATVLLAVLASGCVTLLPKAQPAQLYRFGVPTPAGAQATQQTGALGVRLSDVALPAASGGNDILTLRGDEAAYVKDARWVSSATSLFAAATADVFAAKPGPTRLLAEGETGQAAYGLRLDVRRFEIEYGAGPSPNVVIEVYASLAHASGPASETGYLFRVTTPADEDRMDAIVKAFDKATDTVLVQIVDWVNAKAAA
jgi:cholesterol transport system auxiliary component